MFIIIMVFLFSIVAFADDIGIASYEIATIPNTITSSLRLQPGADLKKALLRYEIFSVLSFISKYLHEVRIGYDSIW